MSTAVLAAPRKRPRHTPQPIYATPSVIRRIDTASDLTELLNELRDQSRRQPVIVTSPHGPAPIVRLAEVYTVVGRAAILVELTNHTAADWQQAWPDNCAVGGATRMFAPGRTSNSRLLHAYPGDDPTLVEENIISWIREQAWTSDEARHASGRTPTAAQHAIAPAGNTDETTLREHRARIRKLEDERRRFEAIVRGTDLFADPTDRFRHETGLAYLKTVPESDRGRWRLPDSWSMASGFLRQIEEHSRAIDRDIIMRAIIDILTGRAREVPGRAVRAHRTGSAGNDPQQVRNDGARAFRANVQTGAHSARRIIWWQHTDGTIELADLACHDNSRV